MSGLLENAVTRTEIQPVSFPDAETACADLRTLLETTTGAEVHLAFRPLDDGRWQIQGVILHQPEQPPQLEVVEAEVDEGGAG